MSQYDYIAASVQSGTEKVAETVADLFPPIASESINQSREDMDFDETVGVRAPTEQEYGGVFYEGDIEGAVRPDSTAPFFTSAMGTPDTTLVVAAGADPAVEPAIYDHLWNPTAVGKVPRALTLWTVNQDESPAIVDKYIGAYVNELGFEVETNGYLTFAASIVALLADDTAAAPALTRDLTFKFPFHAITAEVSVAGAGLAPLALENWNFSYNNNFETDIYRLGSREAQTFRPGNIESSSEFRPVEFIASHYRRALRRSPEFVRLRLLAVGETVREGGTTYKREIEIDIKRLQYLEAPVDIDASEVLTGVDVSANSVVDAANQLVTVRMRNTRDGTAYRP